MKYDFKDISFLIHLRVDIPERLRNLKLVLDYYDSLCSNLEFIIVNDDNEPEPELEDLSKKYKFTKFLFLKNASIYKRTLSFNKAFKQTKRNIVIAGDTDVIIDPKFIIQGANKIINNEADHIFPYNGLFCNVKLPLVEKFKDSLDVNVFLDKKPQKQNRYNNYQDNFIHVASPESKGGCIMYSSELYKRINGYNPNFVGWGYEDDEIGYRIEKFKGITSRVYDDDAIAWHLPHPNTVRNEHPYYDTNHSICSYVGEQSLEILKEYIKTWEI
tara:strand:- start:66 stop:881 length:816 start_codon:yes stop_codon:yes gene_type:complete